MKEHTAPGYDFSVLRELRSGAKVSLERVAEDTGVSFSTLTRIESNQNQPNLKTLSILAGYFGLSPAHLLDLAGSHVIQQVEEELEDLGEVQRWGISFPDAKVIMGQAEAGDFTQKIHRHKGHYQIQWVLEGRLKALVHGREFELEAGQAIKFDAGFEHASRFMEDTRYIVVLVPKRMR